MLHANFTAVCVIEAVIGTMEFSICGKWSCLGMQFYIEQIRIVDSFLLNWPWLWPNDLHIRTWPILPADTPGVQIWNSYVNSFESYHLTDIQMHIQTDRRRIYKPCHFACGQ